MTASRHEWIGPPMLRRLAVAAALAACQLAGAGELSLARTEAQYADWLDATAAVATIDSGLMPRVDGRDRAAWERRRRELTAALTAALEGPAARRRDAPHALRAMRQGFLSNALDASESGRCADRTRRGGTVPTP